jgi:predicted nucleic acid-binding protein
LIVVDSNILIDVFGQQAPAEASLDALDRCAAIAPLVVTDVIYAELCCSYLSTAALDSALNELDIELLRPDRQILHRAAQAFLDYRRSGGSRTSLLPDFFIGAHAEARGASILTRDTRRFATYFPSVRLITPD